MPDFNEFKDFMEHISGQKNHRVVKKVKPTEEEAMEMMALAGYGQNAQKALGLLKSKRQLFWSKVELRTGEVTRDMRWNDKDQMIEVLETDTGSSDDGFPD